MKLEPIEMTVGGSRFMIGNLNCFDSLAVTRLIAPVVPAILSSGMLDRAYEMMNRSRDSEGASVSEILTEVSGLITSCDPVLQRIAAMPEDDVRRVVGICLSCVERWNDTSKAWGRVTQGGVLMFDDLDQAQILALTFRVIVKHLAPFGNALGL